MRVVILTRQLNGFACECLPRLAQTPGVDLAGVIYDQEQPPKKSRHLARKLRKTLTIGPLGALNGIRMRRWFNDDAHQTRIDTLTNKLGADFCVTPTINCERTRELLREAKADLGLSLGNGYIGPRVFSIPRLGMINVHHEVLPEFQGAQSIIWQLHEGSLETGYTIHQVERRLDGGTILHREKMAIELQPTLAETVRHNYARLRRASVDGLARVVANYQEVSRQARSQPPGRAFTTPSFRQFLRIRKQHRRLLAAAHRETARG